MRLEGGSTYESDGESVGFQDPGLRGAVDGISMSGEDEEELEDLTIAQQESDPLREVRLKRVIGGKVCCGCVCNIGVGRISKERLYRIRYEDGDMEDMTKLQVQETLFDDEADQRAECCQRYSDSSCGP